MTFQLNKSIIEDNVKKQHNTTLLAKPDDFQTRKEYLEKIIWCVRAFDILHKKYVLCNMANETILISINKEYLLKIMQEHNKKVLKKINNTLN